MILSMAALARRIRAALLNRSGESSSTPAAGAPSGPIRTLGVKGAAPLTRREVGAVGERLAAELLRGRGYEIIESNHRCRQGEIDLIARHGDCLVFVEVRTRTGTGFGTPEESITAAKKEKLITLAEIYVQSLDRPPPSWRIDVVAVELAGNGGVRRLDHIENAVG